MSDQGWAQSPAFSSASTGVSPPATGGAALASDPSYPVRAGLDAPLTIARWRVIGNSILAIPHMILLYVLNIVASLATFAAWFVVLFTGNMPPGLGNFIAGVHRYQWRVMTYSLFLREAYPSFAVPSGYAEPGGDPAWLTIQPPTQYNRLAVLLRVFLAIPQALYLIVVGIAWYVAVIVAWFAVLFTGRWPEGLRRFVVGCGFAYVRYLAWYDLIADPYPPFATR